MDRFLNFSRLLSERLQASLLKSFANLLLQAASLEDGHLDSLKRRTAAASAAASAISPAQDQDLYIDYNIRPFNAPNNWGFEPCGVHYDTVSTPQVDTLGSRADSGANV